MTAEQLLITKPNMKDLQRTVHDLIAVHNKLVYHVFNSPHAQVLEGPIEPAPIMVIRTSRFETSTIDRRYNPTTPCDHPAYDEHNYCRVCGAPYEKDDDI